MKLIKKQDFLLLCFLIFVQKSYTQNNNPENLYSLFDNATGKEAISLNNGPTHYNTIRTIDKNNFRYTSYEFLKGDVIYENQKFYGVNLKYDLLNDELIYQPDNTIYGINLIKEKVSAFFIEGKVFKNLSSGSNVPEFVSGYYEETVTSEKFIFYTKYSKRIRKVAKEKILLSEFKAEDSYILYHQNNYIILTSQKNIIDAFPEYKTQINNFYKMNKNLSKSDNNLYMKKLFTYINQLIK